MRLRSEDEPDEEPEPEPEQRPSGSASGVPSVGLGGRDYEYRVDSLSVDEVTDAKALAGRLTDASGEGWDLIETIEAGERRVFIMRRPKRPSSDSRPVGFAPPTKH